MENFNLKQTGVEVQELLDAIPDKADKATTLEGYGITDAYTKAEDDALLETKADKSDTYTKEQTDGLLDTKADNGTTLADYGITDTYTKDEVDDLLDEKADKATTLAGYDITDAYTKAEVNNLITTPDQQYVTVEATDQTTSATDVLPATGAANTIYRVGKWDGTQYTTTCYCEYAWDGTEYLLMDVKEYGIDDEPTPDSNNFVESGGVASVNGYAIYNPEWIRVYTDAEGKVIGGIKSDGSVEWYKGIPEPVKEYADAIQENVVAEKERAIAAESTKVDKVEGKSLIDSEFAVGVEYNGNTEYVEVHTDSDGKILYGVKSDGSFDFKKGVPDHIKEYVDDEVSSIDVSGIEDQISGLDTRVTALEQGEGETFLKRAQEQMNRAYSLGFSRLTTWSGDYLPTGWIAPLVFLHVSDTHGGTTRPQMEHAVAALNDLSIGQVNKGRNASFLLHTGDIKLTNFNNDFSYFVNAVAEANKPVFIAIGNHDVGNSYVKSDCGTASQVYDQMIAPFISGWSLATENDGTPHPTGKNYYFKDFTTEKIRMIVLYEYESDYTTDPNDSTKYLYNLGYRAFSQDQIDWLIDSLQTTPEDYGVVIVKHQQENVRGNTDTDFNAISARGSNYRTSYVSGNMLCEIVNAFVNKTHLETTYSQTGGIVTTLEVDADFTSKETTEFICFIDGHSHCDGISFLKDYPTQLDLNIGCDNTIYTHGSDIAQLSGELSEDLINVYSIDRNNRKICVVRIGAYFSNMAQQRIADIYSY